MHNTFHVRKMIDISKLDTTNVLEMKCNKSNFAKQDHHIHFNVKKYLIIVNKYKKICLNSVSKKFLIYYELNDINKYITKQT